MLNVSLLIGNQAQQLERDLLSEPLADLAADAREKGDPWGVQ